MSVRRLHPEQPAKFAFTRENLAWAKAQVKKYPAGKQASAVIPILWRAHEQEGWLTRPAMEYVGQMLDMPFIRVYEVATFYTMFQLSPVGKMAHVQVCGTTPCMLRGAEDLVRVCQKKIAAHAHELSADGSLSWEEVECLGACVNAPMVQVFKDTYEDLTPQALERIIDDLAAGKTPRPGPQTGRQTSAPAGELTSLTDPALYNGKAAIGKKTEVAPKVMPKSAAKAARPKPASPVLEPGRPASKPKPARPDDLKLISGIGPKIESVLNGLGVYTYLQVANWTKKERDWVDGYLKFRGRIERDDWLRQAKALAKGGETEYVRVFGKKPR